MPTRKKKTASPKTSTPTAKKSSVKKPAAKKAIARKPAAKKTAAAKKPAAQKSQPAGPREQKISGDALKLVDQAASLLRQGIRNSANTSEKARHQAKQQAHTLLTKASSSLSDLLSGSTSALRGVINKI